MSDLIDRAVEKYLHTHAREILQESDALVRKAGGVVDPNVLNAIASAACCKRPAAPVRCARSLRKNVVGTTHDGIEFMNARKDLKQNMQQVGETLRSVWSEIEELDQQIETLELGVEETFTAHLPGPKQSTGLTDMSTPRERV